MISEGAKDLHAPVGVDRTAGQSFHDMVEFLPVAVYATDASGRLTYFNDAAVKLSGRVPEIGTDQWCVTWKIFLPDGTPLPHDQCPMAVALTCGTIVAGGEYIAERPDGTRFWFTPYPTVLRDDQGRITGGVNVLVDITARKQAQTESEERFRTIFQTTSECVMVVAADGTLLQINPSGVAMLGAERAEQVVGGSVYGLIAEHDRDRFREFNAKICSGEKASLEFDIVTLAGVRRHWESHAAPLRQLDGRMVQLATAHDITERQDNERTGLLLRAIVDSSDDAIVSKDLNGIITSWNQGAERLFGYKAEEVIGKSITIIIPQDRLDEEPKILARLRRGERVDHFETIRRHKDGTLLNISLTISPVKNSRGHIIGASKIARDITDRKRAEAALIESERRFRELANSMPQIVWTARPDGSVDYCNERWFEFTGRDRERNAEAGWQAMVHPDDLQRCSDAWSAAVTAEQLYQVECRFWDRHEKRWRWFMCRAVPVRDTGGAVAKWFGSFTDIDEQKAIEDELRQANQDLEQFAYSASHDLKEPLRNIKIYSELLAQRYSHRLDNQALEFLGFVSAGATRTELLIRDLLSYTQLSQLETPVEPSDANQALAATLADLSSIISESGARITTERLPHVRVHRAHLQQLFQNLIGNAIKYSVAGRRPEVHISAECHNADCTFAVRDNGIGIHPSYKEKIFGLFKRLHSSDEYSGTGIGLAICKRIVERYHGRIWVESQPGEGSVFRFTLPV